MTNIMRHSGIPWIGDIPNHWEVDAIGNLYSERKEKVSDKDYAPLSVTKNGVLPQLETAAKTDNGDDRKLVKVGDFAINSRSDRRGSCGISQYDGSVSLINTILTPKTEMNPQFYDWLFHTTVFADEFYKWGHGIVDDLWTTRWQEMKHISIVVPPLSEQKAIADYLDKHCAEVDEMVSLQEKIIEELRAYRQAIITETVTRGLNSNAPMKDSGVEWIGQIPQGWEVKRFKDTARVKANLVSPDLYPNLPQVAPDDIEKDSGILLHYQFVKDANIISDNHLFYRGQIIYSKIRPMLNKAIIAPFDGLCSADMYPIETNLFSKYLLYFILSTFFTKQVQRYVNDRVKMPKINKEEISTIITIVPPLPEQQEIADYLDKKTAEIDQLIAIKQRKIEELKEYKKSLIYEYVTGKKQPIL